MPAASLPALAATTPGPAMARTSQIRLLRVRISRIPPDRILVRPVPTRARDGRASPASCTSSCALLTAGAS